jgi:hypothetical protein
VAQTPFDAREITVLISAVFVCACLVRYRSDLQRVPAWRTLTTAMGFLVLGGTATIVEHFVAYDLFNVIEHAAYFLQSVALAAWAIHVRRFAQ